MSGFLVVALLLSSPAYAADLPCPPKRYFCWEVKTAVSIYGEQAVVAKAKQCGWPDAKIAEARRCLK